MNYIIGKHIFLQHPYMQHRDVEINNEYYIRKKNFLEKTNLLSSKKISFKSLDEKEIERSMYNIEQVVFEVTEKCNLNCVYCTFGAMYSGNEERIKEKRNLRKEDAIKLLEYLYTTWKEREQTGVPRKIMIGFYGGEPLMNLPLIKAIVQWTKEHTTSQLTFGFMMTTNGLLLHKYITFLVKHDFITYVSLDGDKENMAYRIDHKGKNCYKRVFNNVTSIKKEYPEFFEQKLNFLTVLHNKNSVEQATHFCMTHFNKAPLCSSLNSSGINPQKKALFSEMSEIGSIKLSKKSTKAMMKNGIGVTENIHFLRFFSGFFFPNYNELLSKENMSEFRKFPTGVCLPFSRKIYMTLNGNLYPCERLDTCFALGNVHDSKVLDAEQIASQYNQYFKNISPACTACERNFSCNKCLFHIDDIQEKKPHCNNRMNNEKFCETTNIIINTCKKHPELYRRIMKRLIFA
ncbi:MAG: radical SAM peptide maturase [Bacteroidetes bacterium]|nr:radical SAM peptide maturase [Bacteroidota bacterium]